MNDLTVKNNDLAIIDSSLANVFAEWKKAGLTPVEVSEEDLIREIIITTEMHTGKMKWSVKKADGIHALATMAVAMKSMYEEYLGKGARPKLATGSPDTKIAIQVENNEVNMAYDQTQDPMVLKGVLMSCIWKLLSLCDEKDPLIAFDGKLNFKLGD